MPMTNAMNTDISIEGMVFRLEKMFKELNTKGMEGHASAVWPVIIRRNYFDKTASYVYEYPQVFFSNLQLQTNMNIRFSLKNKKSDRLACLKLIIDKLMSSEIDVCLFHFATFLIYGDFQYSIDAEGDLSASFIGKRRAQFLKTVSNYSLMTTDDFISAVWSYQIDHRDTDIGEQRRNPSMTKVRILFNPDQFDDWTGTHYSNADWVEPLSGRHNMACKTWTKDEEPL